MLLLKIIWLYSSSIKQKKKNIVRRFTRTYADCAIICLSSVWNYWTFCVQNTYFSKCINCNFITQGLDTETSTGKYNKQSIVTFWLNWQNNKWKNRVATLPFLIFWQNFTNIIGFIHNFIDFIRDFQGFINNFLFKILILIRI